jgi:CheY-like chemotaxis protein
MEVRLSSQLCRSRAVVALVLLAIPVGALAQTDEIQVYDAEIADQGVFNLMLHTNYTPIGRKTPDFPGGIIPNRSVNGALEWLRGALAECGEPYELSVLPDGEAALRFVAEHRSGLREPEPCVIVLDLNLPKHDALAVLAALRSEPAPSHIKVLVVSALAVPETPGTASSNGGALSREAARFPRIA